MLAVSQSPLLMKNRPAVIAAPRTVNNPSNRTRALPLSAMAPMSGATSATMRLAVPLARPNRNVLSVAGTPAFQNCLKNRGKKPAMTVQANEEFAQSYMAQPKTERRVSTRVLVGADMVDAVMPRLAGRRDCRCGTTQPADGQDPRGSACSLRVLACFVKRNVRPPLLRQLQVDP